MHMEPLSLQSILPYLPVIMGILTIRLMYLINVTLQSLPIEMFSETTTSQEVGY